MPKKAKTTTKKAAVTGRKCPECGKVHKTRRQVWPCVFEVYFKQNKAIEEGAPAESVAWMRDEIHEYYATLPWPSK